MSAETQIVCAESQALLTTLDDEVFQAVVCDPPYGIKWMNQKWDYNVPSVAHWKEVLRVAMPGAWLVSFGGSKTSHRVAINIEDAGWELRDTLMYVYGTGKPPGRNNHEEGTGTCLKPCYETIILARKPFDMTTEECFAKYGTAALSIDACRIPNPDGSGPREGEPSAKRRYKDSGVTSIANTPGPRGGSIKGRWPGNLLHDGSDEVVQLFPSNRKGMSGGGKHKEGYQEGFLGGVDCEHTVRADEGSASRFFYCIKPSTREKEEGVLREPVAVGDGRKKAIDNMYQRGKKLRRNTHPSCKPIALMQWLIRLVSRPGSLILDPWVGSGATPIAAVLEGRSCLGIDRDPIYCEIAEQRIAWWRNVT